MRIKNIILYRDNGEMREVTFRERGLNIITGAPDRGKSAILSTVEYILGSTQCSIPFNIRANVSWFGLTLTTGSHAIFLARKSPGTNSGVSPEIYYDLGTQISAPTFAMLRGNINPENLSKLLSNALGIAENIQGTTRTVPATIRHALIFCFQSQSEIANEHMLFHRQSDYWLAQDLKTVFPYFTGASEEDAISVRRELTRSRRQLRLAEREVEEAKRVAGSVTSRAYTLAAEAQNVGLLRGGPFPDNYQDIRSLLRTVVSWRSSDPVQQNDGAVERLQQERTSLTSELRTVREQLRAATAFAKDHSNFSAEADLQQQRLETLSVFDGPAADSCPFCKSSLGPDAPSVAPLRTAITTLREEMSGVERNRAAVEEVIARLETRESEIRDRIRLNKSALDALLEGIQPVSGTRDLDLLRAQVVGRLQLYLETTEALSSPSSQHDLIALKEHVSDLQARLENESTAQTLEAQLQIISREIEKNATRLELTFSDSPLRLDMELLRLEAATPKGLIRMSDFGGGSNYMGYHIAVHLALHRFFITQQRPVPRFLILDQPTQVFFPPDLPEDTDIGVDDFTDEDRAKTRRLFNWLDEYVSELEEMQVIVCDHADIRESWFQDRIVEKWRGSRAFVPYEWMKGADTKA